MKSSLKQFYSIADLRLRAKKRLPKAVFDFFDGGAEDELTLKRNIAAFQEQRFLPKILNDVSKIDHQATILGQMSSMPCAIAPTGAVGFGWHRGDIAIAKAAAAFQIPYCLSTTATASIEQIAQHAPGRLWFQAYILKDQDHFYRLIQRAQDAQYEALMITVDLPVGGKRERDFRNDFSIPFRYTARNLFDFASKPLWALPMLIRGLPELENLIGLEKQKSSATQLSSSVGKNYDPSFDWDRLARIRDIWPRKLIIKGILNPEDALRLKQMGCDAIVVSNHGGRQLDGAIATMDALPAIVKAVQNQIPIYLDGGIRRGGDIVKAMACGAKGVLLGRATLFGALAAGEDGALRALEILQDELKRTMQLCGVSSLQEIDHTLLV
ncbi:MAG: alpha-hydroxy acid oxidase [Betaproteobacteria bacterium]